MDTGVLYARYFFNGEAPKIAKIVCSNPDVSIVQFDDLKVSRYTYGLDKLFFLSSVVVVFFGYIYFVIVIGRSSSRQRFIVFNRVLQKFIKEDKAITGNLTVEDVEKIAALVFATMNGRIRYSEKYDPKYDRETITKAFKRSGINIE